jgi:hypothetical protein
MKHSIKTSSLRVFTLAVATLAMASTGSVKMPVARPHQGRGDVQFAVYLDEQGNPAGWEFFGSGQATHLGAFTSYMSSNWTDPDGTMHGISTAANGDQLFFAIPSAPNPWHLEFQGGNGRFENASGGQDTVFESKHEIVWLPEPGVLFVESWSQKAEGIVKF